MATYEFLCPRDGVITARLPVGRAPASLTCPECDDPARRLFSLPQVLTGDSRSRRIIAATEASASEPAVVTALPGRHRPPTRRPSADPRTAKLPAP
ncbi:zinc ribbon domain-containing protein [Phycicoccus duodecadis]|uniref:Putative regulatory protein FmdB zinc ribbon domain-containing protein n=1 Tax=Phycicoccus duodecadis TaxID=173053 RepID=A0A2N3YMP1_9MICO|nr:zinc ribbon domain-containing protein [Phycicoccus duodecadis]PKW28106.1 hypothetical protein ATL31_2962 [Phycicoccus duodecadis]